MNLRYLIIGILLSGCTHMVGMRDFKRSNYVIPELKNKKVAVVFQEGLVIDSLDTRTDVYTYQFRDVVAGLETAYTGTLRDQTKEFKIVKFEKPPENFDLYIYPDLKSRTVHDFWTMGCLHKFKVEVKNNQQQLIGSAYKEGKKNFFGAGQAQEKCRDAMELVFDEVNKTALEQAVRR